MPRSFKALTLAGIAAIGLGAMPGIAAAGPDHRGWGMDGYGYNGRFDGDYNGYKRAGRWHQNARPRGYVEPARYHRGTERAAAHEHKRTDGDELWPILAIGAIGLTAVIVATQSYAEPPRTAAQVTYVDPPPPAYVPAAGPARPSGPASTCLMTREYQTQVVVGGKMVEAYGQACLQPDGSWYRGPAEPVPY